MSVDNGWETEWGMYATTESYSKKDLFSGTADMVTFDESKNQVIFHGSETMPASLFRQLRPGAPPDEVNGRKITFNRATGQFRIDEGTWLGGS